MDPAILNFKLKKDWTEQINWFFYTVAIAAEAS